MARRKLPPLRALAAFEAAARLGSFANAADELGITRSAVSHQIKSLERHLNASLFSRASRSAELSPAGQILFPSVRDAFDEIESQVQIVTPRIRDSELTIQVYVTVAMKWLIPRLHDFERANPDMRVRLSTSYFDWDFDAANADAAFVLVRKRDPAHYYRPLFASRLTPVCAPSLLTGPNGLKTPQDLAHHRLLYVYTAEEDWRIWLDAAGVHGLALSESLAFDSYILAQEAAIEGRGVAMTIGPFADDEIASGRLAKPFDLSVPHVHAWQFVCPKTQRLRPKIKLLERWLVEQVQTDPQLANDRLDAVSGESAG